MRIRAGFHVASSRNSNHLSLNVVFAGNFLYPQGIADTKRVRHFIDAVMAVSGIPRAYCYFSKAMASR